MSVMHDKMHKSYQCAYSSSLKPKIWDIDDQTAQHHFNSECVNREFWFENLILCLVNVFATSSELNKVKNQFNISAQVCNYRHQKLPIPNQK